VDKGLNPIQEEPGNMKPLSVDALALATKASQPGNGAGWTFFKALLLVSTLLSGGLAAGPADAFLVVTTSGTISSGSESGGLFGLPTGTTSLDGDSYTLIVEFDGLGPNYINAGDGSFAQDSESFPGTTGSVTAIVNGQSLTTPLTNSIVSFLSESLFGFNASNTGFDAAVDFVDVSQGLSCPGGCVPYADLMQPFSYVLEPGDFGGDSYTFNGAGFPAPGAPVANFTGTEATFAFVPEPPSWVLLATSLFGLGLLARRRYA
jgi:hypothetical protein